MYRVAEELAKELIEMIKTLELESVGNTAFLPKHLNSIGIIDPVCCVGSAFHYLIESPKPMIYQNIPFAPPSINAYFLYRKEELQQVQEPWEINRVLIDPTSKNPEEMIDVSDSAIILPDDVEKLTAQTITTMDQLLKKEPLIVDCLNWEKNVENDNTFKGKALSHIPSSIIESMQRQAAPNQSTYDAIDRAVREEGPKLHAGVPGRTPLPAPAATLPAAQPATLSYAIEGHVILVPLDGLGAGVQLFYTLLAFVWGKDKKVAKILKQFDFKFLDANNVQIYPPLKKNAKK